MTQYVATWKDPYNGQETRSLTFGVKNDVVIETTPYMPWAKGWALALVRKYFQSSGTPFQKVSE